MNYLQFFSTVVVLKHRSFTAMYPSIGAEFDKTADYEQKADYHAIKPAKEFVELRMDRAAHAMLENHFQTHSSMEFYRKFFHKHAVVFARRRRWNAYDCRNVSACVATLIRELS
jgi:hypothetical protein